MGSFSSPQKTSASPIEEFPIDPHKLASMGRLKNSLVRYLKVLERLDGKLILPEALKDLQKAG